MTFFTLVLAALGLSFLVFIHELGHYVVARRVGMKVEIFSIGFGPVLYKWDRNGVRWQICWLLFGGYVKIKGMEKEGNKEPYEIPDGFFGRTPWQRIQVALMGPIVNIVFAFIAFTGIWLLGGRDKSFRESTKLIGWVKENSALAQKGLKAGDQLQTINGREYQNFIDILYSSAIKGSEISVTGQAIDYYEANRSPFTFSAEKTPSLPVSLSPARFLIFESSAELSDPTHDQSHSAAESGLMPGDRLVWADGEILFSDIELNQLINSEACLLTVERAGQTFVTRAPRLLVRDMRLLPWEIGEIDDWQHEIGLSGDPKMRFFIPFKLSYCNVIQGFYSYLDNDFMDRFPDVEDHSAFEVPLKEGDRLIAVDGVAIDDVYSLFKELQTRRVNLIVARGVPDNKETNPDRDFIDSIPWPDVYRLGQTIGLPESPSEMGQLVKIQPIKPLPKMEFATVNAYLKNVETHFRKKTKGEQQRLGLEQLQRERSELALGIKLNDKSVRVNTSPLTLFMNAFNETYRTLFALVTGLLNPKFVSGPVGIVRVMQNSWSLGVNEALFWLGTISLNLGLLNLLPIPVLDGGHICFSLVEMVRKKPLKAKTMQRLIIPFVVLLIAFFIFVTYQDILRLFQ